jgi:hypothetical protein
MAIPRSPLTSGRAARILQQRCPACFGLHEWGRPLTESVLCTSLGLANANILSAEGIFTLQPTGTSPILTLPAQETDPRIMTPSTFSRRSKLIRLASESQRHGRPPLVHTNPLSLMRQWMSAKNLTTLLEAITRPIFSVSTRLDGCP